MSNQYKVSKEDYNNAINNAKHALNAIDGKVIDISDSEIMERIKPYTRERYPNSIWECRMEASLNRFQILSRGGALLRFCKEDLAKDLSYKIKYFLSKSPAQAINDSYVSLDLLSSINHANKALCAEVMEIINSNKLVDQDEFRRRVERLVMEKDRFDVKEEPKDSVDDSKRGSFELKHVFELKFWGV